MVWKVRSGWGPKSPLFEILATTALYILLKGKFYVCFDFEDQMANKMEQENFENLQVPQDFKLWWFRNFMVCRFILW